jgi:Putative beta-barrel porin-2, OmpL-like. bbp2
VSDIEYRRKEMNMRKAVFVGLGFLLFALLSSVTVSWAEKEEKSGAMTIDDIKKALGLSLYFQGGFTYNFANPDSQENDLRVFDHRANNFTLDLAEIQFLKDPSAGGVGYKLKLSAGETAKFIHSLGLGIKSGENPEDTEPFDLTEAYISYVAPLGQGLRFDFGKMATYLGAEVIEARDNPNYSRSFLFNYAIPFTHTGLKVSYPFSDVLNASVYILNGWDNSDDNNTGKTAGFSVGYTPIEQFAMNFNFIYGPEKYDNNHDSRFVFDWVGTIKPVKNLAFILNTDYGTEQHSASDGGSATWYGIAGIAKYDFNDWCSLAFRGEYFSDPDGVRTGTAQKLKEITLTPEFRLAQGLILRPEYRHDWSDEEVFDSNSRKRQDTVSLSAMYTW